MAKVLLLFFQCPCEYLANRVASMEPGTPSGTAVTGTEVFHLVSLTRPTFKFWPSLAVKQWIWHLKFGILSCKKEYGDDSKQANSG